MNETTGGNDSMYPIQMKHVVVTPIVLWCTWCKAGIALFDKKNKSRSFQHQLFVGLIRHCITNKHCLACGFLDFEEMYDNASVNEKDIFSSNFLHICEAAELELIRIAETLMSQPDKGRQLLFDHYIIEDSAFSKRRANKKDVNKNGPRVMGWSAKKKDKAMYIRTYHEIVERIDDMCELYEDPTYCIKAFGVIVKKLKKALHQPHQLAWKLVVVWVRTITYCHFLCNVF
jgi:hypothetical protein